MDEMNTTGKISIVEIGKTGKISTRKMSLSKTENTSVRQIGFTYTTQGKKSEIINQDNQHI